MFSCVLTRDHAKSKSEDVTKDASNLQGFCARMGFISQIYPAVGKKKARYKYRAINTSIVGGGGALIDQIGGQANQRVRIF